MKLFSGDKTGNVVCTEVDFYQVCRLSVFLMVFCGLVQGLLIQINFHIKWHISTFCDNI